MKRLLFILALLAPLPGFGESAPESARPAHSFQYTNEVNEDIPWSIHIIKIDRSRRDFEFCTTLGKGNEIGMGIISDQVKSLPPNCGEPLAAINGDFYEKNERHEGRPRNIQIKFGEVVSSPDGHDCFWIAPDGSPQMTNVFSRFHLIWEDGRTSPVGLNQIRPDDAAVLFTPTFGDATHTEGGRELLLEPAAGSPWLQLQVGQTYSARVREVREAGNTPLPAGTVVLSLGPRFDAGTAKVGATLKFVTETFPDLTGVKMAIGGGPALVDAGRAMEWTGFMKLRHPRSAIGWNQKFIYMVVVDGRQSNISVGMTFPEIANYMASHLGCEHAMNFDGGGSTTLWALGAVRNSPSEGDERPAPNALVLLKKPAASTSKP